MQSKPSHLNEPHRSFFRIWNVLFLLLKMRSLKTSLNIGNVVCCNVVELKWPNTHKITQNGKLFICVTMQRWPDQASDNSVNCPEMRVKVSDQPQCATACCSADEMCWFERVRERRHGPAQSLTCFQMTDLVCIDLFTPLIYMQYSINVCRNFPHYKLESCRND